MKRNSLLESLESKVDSKLVTRRYNLPEMISESYRALYACDQETNLRKIVESHLDDVRRHPSDTDRLSRQLCKLKELIRMVESNEVKDEELLVPEEDYTPVKPKEEDLKESQHDEDVEETEDEDLLEDSELTDEEVEELTKHLEEIRKNKKMKECDAPKKSVEESTKPRKLKRSISEAKDPSPEIQDRIMTVLADTIYGFGVEPNDLGELLDELVYNIAMLMPSTDESRKLKRANEASPVWSRYHIVNPDGETIDSYTDRKDAEEWVNQLYKDGDYKKGDLKIVDSQAKNESKSYGKLNLSEFNKKSSSKAFVKTFKKLDKKLHEGTALTRQESIDLYKASNSALTQLSIELEHNPDFLDTFNECTTILSKDVQSLLESLKEGKAPSKKTMKSLSKFSEALLNESWDSARAYDVSKYCLDKGYDTDQALRVVKNQLKKEGSKLPDNDKEIMQVIYSVYDEIDESTSVKESEDEEAEVADTEDSYMSEEAEEFDQEYADARVELHKELADEHAESEDPEVQEKLAQDAEEVTSLPGITDEQVAEITGEETPEEEEVEETDESVHDEDVEEVEEKKEEEPEDLDLDLGDDEITDDELAELKKHLKEMRKARA